jgi:hypothetical protein
MPDEATWMNDWETFVRTVSELFCSGLDDAAATKRFAGKRVVWQGNVSEKCFDERLGIDRPGVAMSMPAITVSLPGGRHGIVNYLFLTLRKGEIDLWREIAEGSRVRFATRIRESSGPFSGVAWSELDNNRGLILFLTDGGVPVGE